MVSSFTSIVYLQCTHMIYVISTSSHYLRITGVNWPTTSKVSQFSWYRGDHGWSPVETSDISLCLCNCLSCFVTCILVSPRCTYTIFRYTHHRILYLLTKLFLVLILREISALLFLASKTKKIHSSFRTTCWQSLYCFSQILYIKSKKEIHYFNRYISGQPVKIVLGR